MNPTTQTVKSLLDQALQGVEEIRTFETKWPSPREADHPMPSFSWEQLERQLADLAGSPERSAMAEPLVSALRKQAWCKPPEMVLREVLCIAWTLMDEGFDPPSPGEAGMT